MEPEEPSISAEELKELKLSRQLSQHSAWQGLIQDSPPRADPVLDYITDFEERAAIWYELCNTLNVGQPLNGAALSLVMTAPLSILRQRIEALSRGVNSDDTENAWLVKTGFFYNMTLTSLAAMNEYQSRGRKTTIAQGVIPAPIGPEGSSKQGRDSKARELSKIRDNHLCVITQQMDPEVCHIFPFAATQKPLADLGCMLSRFWGEEQYQEWRTLFEDRGITESPRNLMNLNPLLHRWFDDFKLGLKPMGTTEDGNGILIQFHWLRVVSLKPTTALFGPSGLVAAGLLDEETYRSNPGWGDGNQRFAHRKSGWPIETGQIFTIHSKDPQRLPLPSLELLELRWNLSRLLSMAGAAGLFNDSDDDSSDDGGLGFLEQAAEDSVWEWEREREHVPEASP